MVLLFILEEEAEVETEEEGEQKVFFRRKKGLTKDGNNCNTFEEMRDKEDAKLDVRNGLCILETFKILS